MRTTSAEGRGPAQAHTSGRAPIGPATPDVPWPRSSSSNPPHGRPTNHPRVKVRLRPGHRCAARAPACKSAPRWPRRRQCGLNARRATRSNCANATETAHRRRGRPAARRCLAATTHPTRRSAGLLRHNPNHPRHPRHRRLGAHRRRHNNKRGNQRSSKRSSNCSQHHSAQLDRPQAVPSEPLHGIAATMCPAKNAVTTCATTIATIDSPSRPSTRPAACGCPSA